MGSPISRRPGGLLDLLLTQQQGRNPDDLLSTLQPVIDLGEFYSAERLSVSTDVAVVTAVGNTVDIEVPEGEAWKIFGFGINAAWATANQDIRIGMQLRISGTDSYLHDFGLQASTGAGDRLQTGHCMPHALIAPSGVSIRGRVNSLNLDAQANIAVTLSALYVRMET